MKINITIIAKKQAMSLRYIASTFLLLLLGYSGFAQVPTITSFAPTSGAIGTTVIISGTNFNTTPANNIVFFGATRATVSAGSATSLTVVVPVGASFQPISVTNLTANLTAYSAKPFITTFPCGGAINTSSFAAKVDFTTGTSPFSVSTGDFDGDGKADLAVANGSSNTVSVFRNTGSSGTISFATKVDFTTGTNPQSVSTGDFDGDGKTDLAVTNQNSNTVSVLRNTGNSGTISFSAKVDFTTGTSPSSVSTGDLDGDGKPDLAIANLNSGTVSVLRNTGSTGVISFATKVDNTTGTTQPISVSTADLDGDGKMDIAVANAGSNGVSVFRNTGSIGTISFAVKVDYGTGLYPQSISIGDLNGDGKLDLAVANYNSGTVSVLRNTGSTGTISFATTMNFSTGSGPYSVSIGDLDGDGKLDLVAANYSSSTISILRNISSSGTISLATKVDFATATGLGLGPRSVSIGDFDGDGKADFVNSFPNSTVSVFRNRINGLCPPTITTFAPTSGPVGTTVIITGTNFNTTPANNIVFFGATRAIVSAGSSTSLTLVVPVGASYQPVSVTNIINGLSAYSPKPFITTFPCGGAVDTNSFDAKVDFTAGTVPYSVSTGDLDGDGKADLAVVNQYSSSVSVFRNTGNSGAISFATKVDFTTGSYPESVSIGDLDGDGKADLAVANQGSSTVSIFRNTSSSGTIAFATKVDFTTDANPNSISTGDFDGDGKLDLAVAKVNSGTVSVYRNTGSTGIISFATKVDFTSGAGCWSVSISDLDGDGKLDLAVPNIYYNSVSVLRNTGSNGIISFATKVDFTTGFDTRSVSIGDLDGDGKPDLAVTNSDSNTVSILRNNSSNGTISFASKVDYSTGTEPRSVSIGDLDGDSKPEISVTNYGSNSLSIFRNTSSSGTISFSSKVDYATGAYPNSATTGDFDGDGKSDLAVANIGYGNVSIFRNKIKLPTVIANASATTVCAGTSITLTAGGSANNYSWSGGITNGVGFVPPTGTTTYTVTGTDTLKGCQNTATKTIIVNALPTVTANAIATTVCAGETITLTGSGNANTYVWSVNGINGGTNGGIFFPPLGTTTYTVTGTINATGCQNTATKTINVNPKPIVTADTTVTTICEGTRITLTGSGNANTYTWSDNVMNGVSFEPPKGTITYTVTGTNTLTGCKNTATKTFIVNSKPISTISATDITKCSGTCSGTATVNATSGATPFSYLWSNGQTTDIASFLCQGNYSVTVTDFNGCKDVNNINVSNKTISNPNIYLTNLAAIDQLKLSPAFASFYSYNLPTTINANSSNPRNFVDPGKKARFKVECTNQKANGQSIVSGICKVRSNSPYIKITDSSSALNNIGWSNKAWSADEFEIDIDTATPPGNNVYIDFVVQENGQDYATTCISIPVAPLVYSATTAATIDDDNNPDSKGNDNDICEPNETIEFYPWLDNRSVLNAEYVRGRFENLDNHSFIKIWNDTQGVNTRVFDATWWNYSFAKPQTINTFSTNTTPEYDFVFNYKNNTTDSDFKLYMVMAGGFKLFNGDALSLVQWSLPYSFNEIVSNDSLTINPHNLSYTSTASSKQVTVDCNRTWVVNSNQPWLTFNKNSGNGNDMLTFNVTANTTNSQRTAIATFTAGAITKTVTIIQDATVGINEINKTNTITIYPNPTSGIVTISSSEAIASINVFDVTGKLVYNQQNIKQTNTTLDLSTLSNGIYFIHALTENGEVCNSKVVVGK